MINKERVRLLVDALRSGEYAQCTGALRRGNDTYCCLGVGCEVAIKNGLDLRVEFIQGALGGHYEYDHSMSQWPLKVADWYGFEGMWRQNPVLGTTDDGRVDLTMVGANDDFGWDFERIAAALEAKYLD